MSNRMLAVLAALLCLGPATVPAAAASQTAAAASRTAVHQAPAGAGPRTPAVTVLAQPGQAYIHTSLPTSVFFNWTYLENPALNGQPSARFLVTRQAFPYLTGSGPQALAQGVWYDGGAQRWAIYNEAHLTNLTPDTSWNVFIPPQDATLITVSSTVTATEALIDDSQFNFTPDAVIFAQHVYNPPGSAGNYFSHTVGVAYDNVKQQWAIESGDGSLIPAGTTFFALRASADETFFTHTVIAASQPVSAATTLDNALINNNPDAQILLAQNFGAGVVNNHEVTLVFSPAVHKWVIVNLDGGVMPVGAVFNVLVIPPKAGVRLQEATPDNTSGNATFIGDGIHPNPDLDNNPDALLYVTHNWNPPQAPNDLYDDHPLGVQYIHGLWAVVNLDGAPMQQGLTFNLYYTWPRGNSFSASASATNASASSLNLNNPLLNGQPNAVAIDTFNATPAGLPGGLYTQPTGLRYYSPLSTTQIFNYTGPTFSITQSYNVLVPNVASSFVVTSTGLTGNSFDIDSPQTNGQPRALVFATPRDNGTLDEKNVGVYYNLITNRWAIFNEDRSLLPAGRAFNVFVVVPPKLYLPLVRR